MATANIAEILVMTDEESAAAEEYVPYPSWGHLARDCRTDGANKAVRAIHDLETAEDPDGRHWPQYKISDDKALAYLRFAPIPLDEPTA
ncbi:hypothetical protein OG568_61265 (plasmid) [Streptomyces sp. NBC_01450]|uniref:hypothetical protein n=1 Tax=Streptomyces sp. NBC_01450 TaxID=2903871 RepID=UPI002E2FBE52|nr:hypothetical protein [Streptomyces sp. NBC_01450]